jgi:hypothetical protein
MSKKPQYALHTIACLLIAVVTLELCARLEDKIRYGAPFFGNYSLDSLYQYDALGKYGKPHASYLKWHLNELGYRGPDLRSGTFRIACIGSSETFGLYETPENEWPRQLEKILNQRSGGEPYETVDIAYPGFSIGSTLVRLPQILSTVRPNMAVIYPSYTPYIERGEAQPWPIPPVTKPAPKPVEHAEWRIGGRLSNFSKTALPERLQNAMRAWQLHRDAASAQALDTLPEKNIEAFQTDLDRATTELLKHGVKVVLVTHANRFGKTVQPEDAPVLTAWRKFYPTLKEEGLLDMERRMSDAVRAVGKKNGVPVVDAANLIPPGHKYFAEFVHFTDGGSSALASLVANEVDREAEAGVIAAAKPTH